MVEVYDRSIIFTILEAPTIPLSGGNALGDCCSHEARILPRSKADRIAVRRGLLWWSFKRG